MGENVTALFKRWLTLTLEEIFFGWKQIQYFAAIFMLHFFMSIYLGHFNGTIHIRHQWRKKAVLSCHRFLNNSGVEKMNDI
jgi:hypothetical protein